MNQALFLRFILFLVINFLGLYLGALFTADAVVSAWYLNLNKSPVTPPGWFFGFAWTTIMLGFAVYMTKAYQKVANKAQLLAIYALQWLLNFSWNPVFFHWHFSGLGLLVIALLTLVIAAMMWMFYRLMHYQTLWLLPYFLWLCVASYLNFYIFINN